MTKTLKERWQNDVARGIDVTMWNAMQGQQIGRKLRIEIATVEPASEAEFFAICTAWSSDHEQNYRFYIYDNGEETVISVYQEDMSRRNAGKSILIEAEQSISELERRCCYEQLRNFCNATVSFLFTNKVWK